MPSPLQKLVFGQPRIGSPQLEFGPAVIEEDEPARAEVGPAVIEAPPPAPQQAAQPAQASDVFERMLSRVATAKDTGIAQAGEGYLPASALRPEVQRLFAPYGGASMIDVRNLAPEEMRMLRLWVDPGWAQRQRDPGPRVV